MDWTDKEVRFYNTGVLSLRRSDAGQLLKRGGQRQDKFCCKIGL
jgi:hypothetical protein